MASVSAPSDGLSALAGITAAKYDPVQVKLMEEEIVVVDENDKVIRAGSKKECHLKANIEKGLLHRAFSVFLFNPAGKLLLQQRSGSKITFPYYWANTCCSHPLFTKEELDEHNSLGVKRAAIRKLQHELGISPSQLSVDDFHHLATIHYVALEEGMWGEHEIDHVLVIQTKVDIEVKPEPNEVHQVRYFDEREMNEFIKESMEEGSEIKLSPWFAKIQKTFLKEWFALIRDKVDLKEKEALFLKDRQKEIAKIHRL